MDDMASKQNGRKKGRKRMKYNPLRLGIVVGIALCMVILVFAGGFSLFRSLKNKGKETASSVVSVESLTSEEQAQIDALNEQKSAALVQLITNIDGRVNKNSMEDLKIQIEDYLASKNIDPSKISWTVQDLVTDEFIESSNAKTNFTAASTYKFPLAVYYYEEIAAGRINPSDTIEFTENMKEKEDDENLSQPIHRKYNVGDKIPIDELLNAALLYSDNIAGHMLYENLGGYTKYKELISKYSDQPQTSDFYQENKNVYNAEFMMHLMHYVYNTPETFNDLKYFLQYASTDSFLNRSMEGYYIQKVGNLNEVRNSVGLSNGIPPYSLVVYSNISKDEGLNVLDDLGVMVAEYFNQRYANGFYDGIDMTKYVELNSQMSTPEDIVITRPGPNGQTYKPLTEEELKKAQEAFRNDGFEVAGSDSQTQ